MCLESEAGEEVKGHVTGGKGASGQRGSELHHGFTLSSLPLSHRAHRRPFLPSVLNSALLRTWSSQQS